MGPAFIAICVLLVTAFPLAQAVHGLGGGGELSPRVVVTWAGHGDGSDSTLDLLVLWRGKAGWLQGGASIGAGGTARIHSVSVQGRQLELRVDNKTNTAHIQDQAIPLQGVNVLLLDDVDSATVRVAGTMWVEPKLADLTKSDPITVLIKESALLTDYLKP